MSKASSPEGTKRAPGPVSGARHRHRWVVAGLALTLLLAAVPAWRVASVLTGQVDIGMVLAERGLRLIDPTGVTQPVPTAEGIVLELGAVAIDQAIRADAARLSLPWANVALGVDAPATLVLRQTRIDAVDPAALADLLPQGASPAARVEILAADWPALGLRAIHATLDPTGAMQAEAVRAEPGGQESRWTLALGAPDRSGARAVALSGAGGALEELSLTGVLSRQDGVPAAAGRIEARAGAWRLQSSEWSWATPTGFLAEGTLVGPGGAGALRLVLPAVEARSGTAALDIAFGRIDLGALGLARGDLLGAAAILPDFATSTLSLRAELISFGGEPAGRDLVLAGSLAAGRLRVDDVSLTLPLGGRLSFSRAPTSGPDALDGQVSLDSVAAARELDPYWPDWLPSLPDGAARIAAERLTVGPGGLAVEGLGWSLAGLPDGRVDAARFSPETELILRASIPALALAPDQIEGALRALQSATPDLPPRVDVEIMMAQLTSGDVAASDLMLAVGRSGREAPLDMAFRAGDLSGAELLAALSVDPTMTGISGTVTLRVNDLARWPALARLIDRPELGQLREAALRLTPASPDTRLTGHVSIDAPALRLDFDALADLTAAAVSGEVSLTGADQTALATRFSWSPRGLALEGLAGRWQGTALEGEGRLTCAIGPGSEGVRPRASISLMIAGPAPMEILAFPLAGGALDANDGQPGAFSILPCLPVEMDGALRADQLDLGPLGVAQDLDLDWSMRDGWLEISRGRLALAGGAAEFAGTVPLRSGLPDGQAWMSVTGVPAERLLPVSWAEDIRVAGAVDGDVVLDLSAPEPGPDPVHGFIAAARGEARLIWSAARIIPRLDPDGLGRLANARALAGYVEGLFQDGPSLQVDAVLSDGALNLVGARWNGVADGSPLALTGMFALVQPSRIDLMARLDRPGFPSPYLGLEVQGALASARLRVGGSWLRPR